MGTLKNIDNELNEMYNFDFFIRNFEVGKFIGQKEIGILSLESTIEGSGFDMQSAEFLAQGAIHEFGYNNYIYRGIEFEANYIDNLLHSTVNSIDENLNILSEAEIVLSDTSLYVDLFANIVNISPKALNFHNEPLKLMGEIRIESEGSSPDSIQVIFELTNAKLNYYRDTFPINMTLNLLSRNHIVDLKFTSDYIDLNFDGEITLTEIPGIMTNHFNKYICFADSTDCVIDSTAKFNLNIDFKKTNLLSAFVLPNINKLKVSQFNANYSAQEGQFQMTTEIPELIYDEIKIDTLRFSTDSDSAGLKYYLYIKNINDYYNIPNLTISGDIADNKVNTTLEIRDENDYREYFLNTETTLANDFIGFSLTDSIIILNEDEWMVPKDNQIVMQNDSLFFHDFSIESVYGYGYLSLNSIKGDNNQIITDISFRDFVIYFLSKVQINFLPEDDLVTINGNLNGAIKLIDFPNKLQFDSDISIMAFRANRLNRYCLLAHHLHLSDNHTDRNAMNLDSIDQYSCTYQMVFQHSVHNFRLQLNCSHFRTD